jgi:hypothetical protein
VRIISVVAHYTQVIRGLLSFAACACLAFAASTAKPVVHGQYAAQTDAQIEQTIKAKLAKSKIGADHFKVRVQGGVAYWEGNTNVIQHKGSATRMAKTAGARAVVNNIQISDAAKQKARDNLEGGRRRAQVKRGDERSEPRTEASRTR